MGCGASSSSTATSPQKYEVSTDETGSLLSKVKDGETSAETTTASGKDDLKSSGAPELKLNTEKKAAQDIESANGVPKTARGSVLQAQKLQDGFLKIRWKIAGEKRAGDGDWIGAFEGPASTRKASDVPWWDISKKIEVMGGAIVLSIMTNGKASGEANAREPDVPGEYHFRYFFRDREDEPAAVSDTILIGKAEDTTKKEPSPQENRHLRRNSIHRQASVRLVRSRLDMSGPTPASQTMQVSGDVSYCLWSANVTEPGFYPEAPNEHKNQDAFCVHAGLDGDGNQHLFGVFDGHGPKGELCAQYVRDNLPETLLQSAHFDDDAEKACHSALRTVNLEMRREPAIDDTFSGTTAVVLMVRGRQIVVSNVGDSRAIIARPETVEVEGPDGHMQPKDIMKAYDLTNDQTPFREDERLRVKQCGAQVLTMDEVEGLAQDITPEQYTADDPPLLWVPNTLYPGTAFTRSIGDMLAERIGVVPTPEVLTQELGADDRFIVIATDGVWEFLSSQDVADIVSRCFTPLDAARAVVSEAKRLWLELDCRTDDITCIVIFITGLQAPSKPVDLCQSVDIYSSLIGDWYGTDYVPSVMGLARQAQKRCSIKKSAALLSYKSAAVELSEICTSPTEDPYKELDDLPPKNATDMLQLRSAIKANLLFADLDDEQVSMVVNLMEAFEVRAGQVIFSQGEQGDWFYVIKSGTFDVHLQREITAGETVEEHVHTYKSSWGTSASFGEMALMYNRPRPATVKARSEGELWRLHRRVFHRFQQERLEAEFETGHNEDYTPPADLPKKTEDEQGRLEIAVKSNFLFANMPAEQKKAVFHVMERKVYDVGDVVYVQGELGHWFYVVDSGEFEVCVQEPGAVAIEEFGKVVHVYKGGKHMQSHPAFGEQALMYGKPRGATVRAKTPGALWALHRQAFQVAVKQFKSEQLAPTPAVSLALPETKVG